MLEIINKSAGKRKKQLRKSKRNKMVKKLSSGSKCHFIIRENLENNSKTIPLRGNIRSHDELLQWIDTVYDHYN